MHRLLKALPPVLSVVALCVLGFFITSCGSGNQAQIRFVNAISDAGQLDIDFNSNKYFTDIAFPDFQPSSGYTAVPAGSDTIEGFATGTTTEAFENSNVNLNAGTEYTVVATGFVTSTSSVVIMNPADTNTEPANGTVNFRLIDASPSEGAVDIYIYPQLPGGGTEPITPPATIPSLNYQSTSSYVPLPYNSTGGGVYIMYVCTAGSTTPIFSDNLGSIGSASEGSIRTIVLIDNTQGTGIASNPIILDDLN
jgi:hypothetical protein